MNSEGIRKFEGRKYEMLTVFPNKTEAQMFAKRWRLGNRLVRVTKESNGMYYIWSRKNDMMSRTDRR